MAKVYPQNTTVPSFMSDERQTFTIWMRSLICHTNGCTVFNSTGEIIFRVDNYDTKCSKDVSVMDFRGRVVVTIRRKGLQVCGRWYGYKCSDEIIGITKEKPWFQVKKYFQICMGRVACQVTVGMNKFWVVKLGHGPSTCGAFRIVDISGDGVAEVKQKQSRFGNRLGEDVLAMVVEPNVDHSLVMGIVTAYGMITQKM